MAYSADMNVADIRAGLAAGDFTAREIVDESFKRIEELDGDVHAFLELTKEAAITQLRSTMRLRTEPLVKWVRLRVCPLPLRTI